LFFLMNSSGDGDVVIISDGDVEIVESLLSTERVPCFQCTILNPPESEYCCMCGLPVKKSHTEPSFENLGGSLPQNGNSFLHEFERADTPLKGVLDFVQKAIFRPGGQAPGVLSRHPTIALSSCPLDFYSQSIEGAGWACGYRCIQILLSSLLAHPKAATGLFDGSGEMPRIPLIQATIEKAWGLGLDDVGREQLGGRLRGGTGFIGAGEAVAFFKFLGVPAQWESFHSFEDPNLISLATEPVASRVLGIANAAADLGGRSASVGRQTTLFESFCVQPSTPLVASFPPWHSCRPCNFDICRDCFALESTPSHPHTLQPAMESIILHRECDICGGGSERRLKKAAVGPAKTVSERFLQVVRHMALLRWAKEHWGVDLKPNDSSSAPQSKTSQAPAPPGSSLPFHPVPAYLQHDGHSRVLVGYEVVQVEGGGNGPPFLPLGHLVAGDCHISLLLLDPALSKAELEWSLTDGGGRVEKRGAWASRIKRGLHTLRNSHYELVWIPPFEEWGKYPIEPSKGPRRHFL